jgi:hypothetical protein
MKETIWMEVTTDELELPLVTANSAVALAEKCGVSKNTVWMSVSHRKKRGTRTRFVKVEIDDETEEKQ